MRHKTIAALLATGIVALAAGPANATGLYKLDTFLFSANLTNSGDATETNALNTWLRSKDGVAAYGNVSATFDSKVENANLLAKSNGDGEWYLDFAPNEPGFFLLKFGTPKKSGKDDTYFFENVGELTKLVWSDALVNHLSGGSDCGPKNDEACNIGRLSHYTFFADPPAQVPEPGSLALLGLGLGLAGLLAGRRQRS